MGSLTLVRHGQASFFADNYDQLSPLGEQQARLLGEYWLRRGVRFDEVYTGPRVRQIETAALAGEAFARAGLEWPEPKMIPELDEHHVDRMMKASIRQIVEEYPHVGGLLADYKAAQEPRDKHCTFQLMFEQVVGLWVAGKIGAPLRSGYSAAKHALHGFFDTLRAEVFADNIKVTIVCPTAVRTNISMNAMDAKGDKYG